jgi:ribosomal-protein-alanine N-acetyltransferase
MLEINLSPFPVLITERLCLRQLTHADSMDMFMLRSNPAVMKHIGRPLAVTVDDAIALIETVTKMQEENNGINYGIVLNKNPSVVIGTIGLFNFIKEHYRAEIGYLLHPDYWGMGIMTEAIQAVKDFAFHQLNLHSLEAKIDPFNTASAAILEKNKFIKEAHFKENFYWKDQFLDTIVYSLINK